MRPIRETLEIEPGHVLYHSAFGFARVREVSTTEVALDWEHADDNLPVTVGADSLRRVYAACARGGFFDQALNTPDDLRELLQIDPPRALFLLLADLTGPQDKADLREWVVGRALMTGRAFDRWWDTNHQALVEDGRFQFDHETVTLTRAADPAGPAERLANPALSPARRLEVALAHRAVLDEADFRAQVLLAWRTGGQQVRDLALSAMKDTAPDVILRGLLAPGPDPTEAVVHAIRRGGWPPEHIDDEVLALLVRHVIDACHDGGPLDSEGRFAAALSRWGCPGIHEALAGVAHTDDGRRLVRATTAALPHRRAEALVRELADLAVRALPEGGAHLDGVYWLTAELLERADATAEQLADQVADAHPALARWLREEYDPFYGDDLLYDEGVQTAELEVSWLTEAVSLGEAQRRTGLELLRMALALSAELMDAHDAGRLLHPTPDSVQIAADNTATVTPGDPALSPRPPGEPPSPTADVHAMAVLLVGFLLGRPWPRDVPAWNAVPYLRHVVPELPPSSLAPLDAALHPDPLWRPRNGREWHDLWRRVEDAEDARAYGAREAQGPLAVGYDSHVGRAKVLLTQTNQDALYVATKGDVTLLLVCDGISTATAGSGDVASGITAHVVSNLWEQALERLEEATHDELFDFLDRALRTANQAVCEAALRFAGGAIEGRIPMGTTAVAAVARGNRVALAWLGDSRAYVVGPYGAALLTADMNQAGERLRVFATGATDAWEPHGYALVGYVGHFDPLHRPAPLEPMHVQVTLLPGERLVLCTDGVTDYMAEVGPDVSAALCRRAREGSVDDAARGLVELANRGGGGDNTTAVVAEVCSDG